MAGEKEESNVRKMTLNRMHRRESGVSRRGWEN